MLFFVAGLVVVVVVVIIIVVVVVIFTVAVVVIVVVVIVILVVVVVFLSLGGCRMELRYHKEQRSSVYNVHVCMRVLCKTRSAYNQPD